MELTPIQKLDAVLSYLNKIDKPPRQRHDEIQNGLKAQGITIETKALFEILHKLTTDKMCYNDYDGNNMALYWSTFDGQLLEQNGGYKQKYENEKLNMLNVALQSSLNNRFQLTQARMELLQTESANLQTQLQSKIADLTYWIMIATAIAGVYYTTQIIQWLLSIC